MLKLVNGRMTIDKRGATSGCAIDVIAATAGIGEDFVGGQSHQALLATMGTTATAAAAIARGVMGRRRGTTGDTLGAGSSAMDSGRSA